MTDSEENQQYLPIIVMGAAMVLLMGAESQNAGNLLGSVMGIRGGPIRLLTLCEAGPERMAKALGVDLALAKDVVAAYRKFGRFPNVLKMAIHVATKDAE